VETTLVIMESAISMTNTVIASFTSGASFDFADLD